MDTFKLGRLRLAQDEAIIIGDPCYFDDTPHGYAAVELGWAAGEYSVFLATDEGLPSALILYRRDWIPDVARLTQDAPLRHLGVDSGQMAIIAASILPTWTENAQVNLHAPTCDYDWVCAATLESQLSANFIGSRLVKRGDPHSRQQIGKAVATSTRYGDGQYPLYVAKNESGITAVIVVFHWNEMSDDDEWDEAENSDDPPYPDWTRIPPELLGGG